MFRFGAAPSTNLVPDSDGRAFVHAGLARVSAILGPPRRPVVDPRPTVTPRGFDDFFAMICAAQDAVGETQLEFTLLELSAAPEAALIPIGDARGHLLHSFEGGGETVLAFSPGIFRSMPLLLASVAREIGRLALDHRDHLVTREAPLERAEADAELAALMLGLGAWQANGAYLFENSCCGGGCGLDLKSMRAGLTMPEVCYALALVGRATGASRRATCKGLSASQAESVAQSWSLISRDNLALPAPNPAAIEVAALES